MSNPDWEGNQPAIPRAKVPGQRKPPPPKPKPDPKPNARQ